MKDLEEQYRALYSYKTVEKVTPIITSDLTTEAVPGRKNKIGPIIIKIGLIGGLIYVLYKFWEIILKENGIDSDIY